MQNNEKLRSGLWTGFLSFLFFVSFAVVFVIHDRQIYYRDIDRLNLTASTGYSKETILANYDALIDYCSPWYRKGLSFPSLPSSDQAIQHFAEVKNIFHAFHLMLAVSLCLLIWSIYRHYKKKEYHYLKVSALTTLLLPTIIGVAVSLNFDQVFLLFHKLCFRNDYWLFNPVTDPIILLLPEQFFFHCAVIIVTIILAGSVLLYVAYLWARAYYLTASNVVPPQSTSIPPNTIRQIPK